MYNVPTFERIAIKRKTARSRNSFVWLENILYFLFVAFFLPFIGNKMPEINLCNGSYINYQSQSSDLSSFFSEVNKNQGEVPQMNNPHLIDINDIHFENNWSIVNYLQKPKVGIPLQYIYQYPKNVVGCPVLSIIREKIEYYHLSNAWVSCENERIVTKENGIFKLLLHQPKFDQPFKVDECVAAFDHVLFLPFKFQWLYGHWLNEGLSMIISMPQEILDLRPVIITSTDPELIHFTLQVFGMDYFPIFDTKTKFVYGKNVYMCKAFEDVHGFGITTYPRIKAALRQFFNLEAIKPTEYIFMNKKPKQHRYFTNLNDVIALAKKETNLDWKLIDIDYKQRETFAKTIASAKIYVVPCGSIAFNALYMADGTGLVTIGAQLIDYPNQRFAYFINIWCITVIHHSMSHNFKPCQAIPENVVKCIKIMNYAVENQKWPENHKLMESFNIKYIDNLYSKEGDKFILFDNVMHDLVQLYNDKLEPSERIPLK